MLSQFRQASSIRGLRVWRCDTAYDSLTVTQTPSITLSDIDMIMMQNEYQAGGYQVTGPGARICHPIM